MTQEDWVERGVCTNIGVARGEGERVVSPMAVVAKASAGRR